MLSPFSFLFVRCPSKPLINAYQFSNNSNNIIYEGIYLASKLLWRTSKQSENYSSKGENKKQLAYNKYWIRSCMRCTPFGTFAGVVVASITDEATSVILNKDEQHFRVIRLDMACIAEIISHLLTWESVLLQVKYYVNNSIYQTQGSFRFAEYKVNDGIRKYQITEVKRSSYIDNIISNAKTGLTFKQIMHLLTTFVATEEVEMSTYVKELINSQLLISELEVSLTGQDPLLELIEKLKGFKGDSISIFRKELESIYVLTKIKTGGLELYQQIEAKIQKLLSLKESPKNTLQVDLFFSTQKATINAKVVNAIVSQIEDLMKLCRVNKNRYLEDFKKKFELKYEQQIVPLSIVIDSDLGIGYANNNSEIGGSELTDDLHFSSENVKRQETDHITDYTFSKYHEFIKQQQDYIVIEQHELEQIFPHYADCSFSRSMYLMGCLYKQDGILDSENFLFDFRSLSGPSAANLISRFIYDNKKLLKLVDEIILSEEKNSDCIYAEIIHLPQDRVGNVLIRPILRKYEIPYLAKSGASQENQIYIEDIFVTVRNKKVILYSKRHNKRIIPRLTSAHNYKFNSLPIYHFLCDLQFQDISIPIVWDWGILESVKHLPRVVYKNIVLKRAEWRIDEKDFKNFPLDETLLKEYFLEFCRKHKIPQKVVFVESDNELLIDFAQSQGIVFFIDIIKKRKKIRIHEFLATSENCMTVDNKGFQYNNELIIPLSCDDKVQIDNSFSVQNDYQDKIIRNFTTNSQWVYYKLYAGEKSIEQLLIQKILPFILRGLNESLFEKFFFIRYHDEFPHLRLRFYTFQPDLVKKEFGKIVNQLIKDGSVWKIALDTYSREIERYFPVIDESEALFFSDSLCVLRLIDLLSEADSEKYRVLLALRGVDEFMNDFLLKDNDKLEISKNNRKMFFKELGSESSLFKQLNIKYKKWQTDIFSHMNKNNDVKNGIEEAVFFLNKRSEMNSITIDNIFEKLKKEESINLLGNLVSSYIHMFINRLFLAQQRKYELVIYHFLERYYMSKSVLQKNGFQEDRQTKE